MKVKAFGPYTTKMPDGTLVSPVPNEIITVDDANEAFVARWRELAAAGMAEILEDVAEPEPDDAGPAGPDTGLLTGLSIDELRAKAAKAGVTVDNRWGADRLRREIEAAAK